MQVDLIKICAVGAGGFLGATSRYLLSIFVQSKFPSSEFPYGTFVVNIMGCLLIGLLIALFGLKEWGNEELRLFIFVGLLGGFTTFSTFTNESYLLFRDGELLFGLVNIAGQVLIGLLFVWIGYSLTKIFS